MLFRSKTLMALADDEPVCVIIPSDKELSLKKLAAVFHAKSARMMKPSDAERISGYKVGGISPFGQMRKLPTAIEATALNHPFVYINGGQRGLQVRLSPHDAKLASQAVAAHVIA